MNQPDPVKGSALVLIPAYNAVAHLEELITRIREFVCDENLLFINDGSTDRTADILTRLDVPHVTFRQNRGKGAAIKAGFRLAVERGYASVITLDADLQHLPEELPAFLAKSSSDELVIGTRARNLRNMPLARLLTNGLTSLIISIFSTQRVRDSQSGYRLIPIHLIKQLVLESDRYDFESEILFKAGFLGCKVSEVPISTIYEESTSYIRPGKDTLRFIRQIWRRIWF